MLGSASVKLSRDLPMARDNEVYLLRFYPPASLLSLPKQGRASTLHSHFEECMTQIRGLLAGIEVISRQDYLLTAVLRGPHAAYDKLKVHLARNKSGELVQDSAGVMAAGIADTEC